MTEKERKREIIKRAREMIIPRITKMGDAKKLVDYLLEEDLPEYEYSLLFGKGISPTFTLNVLQEVLDFLKFDTVDMLENFVNNVMIPRYSTKLGNVLWPIRVAISGKTVALPLYESMKILEEFYPGSCTKRIDRAIKMITNNHKERIEE